MPLHSLHVPLRYRIAEPLDRPNAGKGELALERSRALLHQWRLPVGWTWL